MGDFQDEALPGGEHGMLGNGYTVEQLRDMLTQHRFEVADLIHEKLWIWATVRRPSDPASDSRKQLLFVASAFAT